MLNRRGRPRLFSHPLIQMLLLIKLHYQLTYRSLEGFAKSILPLFEHELLLPTYSLICKRASKLHKRLPKLSSRRPKIIMLDATGIKVYGEGEWKRKIHGISKRRKWLKLHIAVDAKTQEIISLEVTSSNIADCITAPSLIKKCLKKHKNSVGRWGLRHKTLSIIYGGTRGEAPHSSEKKQ